MQPLTRKKCFHNNIFLTCVKYFLITWFFFQLIGKQSEIFSREENTRYCSDLVMWNSHQGGVGIKSTGRGGAVEMCWYTRVFGIEDKCVAGWASINGWYLYSWDYSRVQCSLYCMTFSIYFMLISEIISDIGTSLFYHVTGAMDDNVMNYQPTVQFFTSCVEILGKVSGEQQQLS